MLMRHDIFHIADSQSLNPLAEWPLTFGSASAFDSERLQCECDQDSEKTTNSERTTELIY